LFSLRTVLIVMAAWTLLALRIVTGANTGYAPIRFTGDLTFDRHEQIIEHEFSVPKGVTRVSVELEYSGKERRTVIDLGLRSPGGIRGWSGGREAVVHVSALTATPGYVPGPIEPGRWAVLLGVPNIRRDSRDSYSVTIRLGRPRRRKSMDGSLVLLQPDLHRHALR
jgi:hypothetical protein